LASSVAVFSMVLIVMRLKYGFFPHQFGLGSKTMNAPDWICANLYGPFHRPTVVGARL